MTVILAAIADLTLTVRFGGSVVDTVVVQVVDPGANRHAFDRGIRSDRRARRETWLTSPSG